MAKEVQINEWVVVAFSWACSSNLVECQTSALHSRMLMCERGIIARLYGSVESRRALDDILRLGSYSELPLNMQILSFVVGWMGVFLVV